MSEATRLRASERLGHESLARAWGRPPGLLGWLSAVNHKEIGLRFIVTAFAFLLTGGALALAMRAQLAVPENDVLSADVFNSFVTMHGTTMMFLFAVPILEGLGMYFLPLMLGTRDLPFPRLNAFGYWTYLAGGLLVYGGFVAGAAPQAGWFAYPPLSGRVFSPDSGMDFWLLGVTLTEIAAIVGAIELVVAFFKRRAPGMTLRRIPVFAWSILVAATMILVAFPALVVGSVLLELDRLATTRFYDPTGGGEPLLWQHLFWFFGHPEVYVIFLPAAGIVSMVIPVFARRRLAGYGFVVAATVAIGVISFGLWVHHMFTVGLPLLALSFFAAASFLIVLPNGVQVFAWLATMLRGRPRLATPMLYVVGFLVIFVVGGITGVMVASVPFDWQAHDSYFVVAHLHYVLIGGMVFPLLAGLYYWFPKWSGRLLSERVGITSFWLSFVGFNLAFFPQHIAGLDGMPRRIVTYEAADGWAVENALSTIGAFVFAAGVGLTLAHCLTSLRRPATAPGDPWGSGSLEWATSSPPPPYNFARIPTVSSADPLWDDDRGRAPGHEAIVEALADAEHGRREVVETSAGKAVPERIVSLPGPSLWPLAVAGSLVVALIGVLLYSPALAVAATAAAVAAAVAWVALTAATRTRGPDEPLPHAASGGGLWGAALTVGTGAVALACLVFAYLYLLAETDGAWPPPELPAPDVLPAAFGIVLALGGGAVLLVGHRRARDAAPRALAGITALGAILYAGVAAAALWAAIAFDADPQGSAYASITVVLLGWQVVLSGLLAVALVVVAIQLVQEHARHADDVSLQIGVLVAGFTTLSCLVVVATVVLVPRLTGG